MKERAGSNTRRPGLQTLADHLGLSKAAVSRVLSGAPAAGSIPPATQARIFEAARHFGYQPNVLARSLRERRSSTVGVMLPEVSEGYATLVLSGIEQRLLEANYLYLVVSHHHRPELILKYQQLLLGRAIDGMITVDTPTSAPIGIPLVTVSAHHRLEGVTNITLNHRRAASLAIEHLHALGHRRLAVIKGQEFSSDTAIRWKATCAAAEVCGLELHRDLVVQLTGYDPTHEPGFHATKALLATGKRFTALLAFNDISAIGAVRALREAGLRVPEDVSVMGFDDVQSAAFQNPALTTIRQPLQAMGMLAAQTVLEQIADPAGAGFRSERIVQPELVVRASTTARRGR